MELNETKGDHHNTYCPHCGKKTFYTDTWEIAITASTHDPSGD